MNDPESLRDEDIALHVAASIAEIDRADWDRLAGASPGGRPGDPFLSYDFLQALEATGAVGGGSGWHSRHLRLDGIDGRPRAVAPVFLKGHSQGEYVFDHGWAQAYERAGGRYYPKLQVSVPFTPVPGPRLLAAPQDVEARRILVAGLEAMVRQGGLSSAHATFLTERDVEVFRDAGWSLRHDRQYHFPNRGYRDHADFLSTLLGRKRKQILRERREAQAGLDIVALTGPDIEERHWDAFFAFYMHTGARKWGRPYLNRAFFAEIGARMADRCLLVLALDQARPIAGALNFIGDEALYGRWWGAVEERPFLHFEVCYHQAIDWAIAHGLARVEAGAQGEHKIARGYLPVTTTSAHFIADPGFRAAVDRFLERERADGAAIDEELETLSPYADRPRTT
ncbi:MAG: GNAT family N-acetyltransferase [Hyphomicrobiales bacterium]|nr:GNAT family N-acetyltransferase [Hyphomicrobiales bacterium]